MFVLSVLAVSVLSVGVGVGVSPVTAQQDNSTDVNINVGQESESESESGSESEPQDIGKEDIRLDSETVITDWSYTSETFIIQLNASEKPSGSSITLTQAVQLEEGATRISMKNTRIRGESTLRIDVPRKNGQAGVSLVSERSLAESQTGVILSTGQSRSNPFNTDAPQTVAWLGAAAVTLLMGVAAFRRRIRGGRGEPETVVGTEGER